MRNEARSARRFYCALSALLFAAACAWIGAAGFGRLFRPQAAAETPEISVPCGTLRGILLRRETRLDAAPAGAGEGTRLSAAETGSESALFFTGCDGWEYLSPADAEKLTPEALEALLARPPEDAGGAEGRLVFGFDCCLAAFFEGGDAPPRGACRLRLADGELAEGCVVSAAADAQGRTALLLRLTVFPEALYGQRFVEAELLDW